MNKIDTLRFGNNEKVMLYMHDRDDGLMVYWSHGRMEWFRCDNNHYVNHENYSYWTPV